VHANYPENTPMANLLLTMLDKAGVPTPEKIGDSTEHLGASEQVACHGRGHVEVPSWQRAEG